MKPPLGAVEHAWGRGGRHRRLGRTAASVLILTSAAAACGNEPGHAPARPPKISFAETAYAFGRVAAGTTVMHAFVLSNRGGLDLSVNGLRKGCGLRARVAGNHPVPPGGTAVVETVLDTANLFGDQRKTITVYSNDPERPAVLLQLTGEVVADIAALPPFLYVGEVRRGREPAGEVRLAHGGEITVGSVSTSGPAFTVREKVGSADPPGIRLGIEIAADAPFGPFEQTIRVHSNSGSRPELLVPVTGIVTPDLTVSPRRVEFDAAAVPGGATAEILVTNSGRRKVRIAGVDWAPPLGDAEVLSLRDGFRYRIRLSLHVERGTSRESGVIRIRTDDPDQSLIEVPFALRHRDAQATRKAES